MKTLKWGTIVLLLLIGKFDRATGQTLTNLWQFSGVDAGLFPEAALMQGSDGNFYGTTFFGGNTNLNNGYGFGIVFRVDPSGNLTNLHSFSGYPNNEGANPRAVLVQGSDGNFYGTTLEGGVDSFGTVFRISPSGSFTNLYSFGGDLVEGDGNYPEAGLVQGADGTFYGTTVYGGTNDVGTVFRITPSGTLTNIWQFTGGMDGGEPMAGLVQGSDGSFYGTTYSGGASNLGTVFRISPSGSLTNLHSFGGPDGANPSYAVLVQGGNGIFYGLTSAGGASNSGTVFRITADGNLTTLYSFSGGSDGANPQYSLVLGSDGNLYGTTPHGGGLNLGTVFRISPGGSLTSLSILFIGPNGNEPEAGLVQGSDGAFYGTTTYGGANAEGTVFKLSVPLNPPANQISSILLDSSGTHPIFSIPSVAGETYQLQFTIDLTSGTWSNVPNVSVTNSIGAVLTLTNFGGAVGPKGFYRFAITP